jgi:hypothetical protein
MAWQLRAQMTEACSCNMFCPCWFAVKEQMVMDKGWCGGSLSFEIDDGRSEGVDLAGRTVVLLAHWPGPTLFDGNGTARLFIDQDASDEQVRELSAIFQGQKGGGVMEVFASFMSTWLPVERTAIRVTRDGDSMTASVGEVGRISSKAIRDDQGKGFTMRGGGFIGAFGMEEAELAPTAGTKWSDPKMPRAFETRSGARGRVRMNG